ncbi:MAG: hypothetical protein NVS3B26_09510 [Mycobacteriales bacterium]
MSQLRTEVTQARRVGVAGSAPRAQTERVLVSSYHYLEGPLIAVAALGLIILICRWVFATDRPTPTATTRSNDFGLLEPVAVVRTHDDATMLRSVLTDAGIRGTIADAPGGFAVLVFRDDASRARELVRS